MLSGPARKDALLNLLFVNIGLVGDVVEGGSLGHCDHGIKFKIFNAMRKSTAESCPLQERTSGEPAWGAALEEYIFEGQGLQKCCSIFRNYLLEAQE